MTRLLSNSPKKPINKWLIGFMLLTITLTAWTAFNDNKVDDLSNNKPLQKGVLEKSPSIQSQANQQILETTASERTAEAANSESDTWQQVIRKPPSTKPYNVFKVHSWVVVPPVVKQKPQPVPPPVAPPAPFTYMGKLEDPIKGTQVFLMLNGRLYSVFKGEKIDQQWRLDTEDDNNIRLTFIPLNLPQVLSKAARPTMPTTPVEPAVLDTNT